MGSTGDAATEFFDELAQRGEQPSLRKLSGTVRFELVDRERTEVRYVSVDKGRISVSRRRSRSDSVIRADRAVFAGLARGELNPVAAVLRGELEVEGDWRLLVLVQRLFPGPSSTRAGHAVAGHPTRR